MLLRPERQTRGSFSTFFHSPSSVAPSSRGWSRRLWSTWAQPNIRPNSTPWDSYSSSPPSNPRSRCDTGRRRADALRRRSVLRGPIEVPSSFEDIQEWDLGQLEEGPSNIGARGPAAGPDGAEGLSIRGAGAPGTAPRGRPRRSGAGTSTRRPGTSSGHRFAYHPTAEWQDDRSLWLVGGSSIHRRHLHRRAQALVRRSPRRTGHAQRFDLRLDDLVGHHVACNGFIDLRPHALVTTSRTDQEASGRVFRADTEEASRRSLKSSYPISSSPPADWFPSMHRLRGLADYLQVAQMSLGTHTMSHGPCPATGMGTPFGTRDRGEGISDGLGRAREGDGHRDPGRLLGGTAPPASGRPTVRERKERRRGNRTWCRGTGLTHSIPD